MTIPTTANGPSSQQLQLLLRKIEKQLEWGASNNWRHQDFQTLSEKILEKTGEQLSTNTLKRIWGKIAYNSSPNSHTLNTLAQFAGYENWLSFQSNHEPIIISEPKELKNPSIPSKPALPAPTLKLFGSIALLLLVVIAIISLIPAAAPNPLSPAVIESIEFSSHRVASGVPNTVIFKYDVSKVPSDNIQIQQNWEESRRFPIQKDQFEVASTYYYPGHWRAKLVVDNEPIKEHDIYIKSEGWLATINREPIPRYLKKEELIKADYLGISQKVHDEIVTNANSPELLNYHYVEEFPNLESNNFSVALSFKNNYTKGDAVCQFSRIVIDCTKGVFIIPFSIPGCVGDLEMRYNKVHQSGKNHNFSAFGCDFQEWQHFKMEVKDKTASVFLNNQLIHEVSYLKNAGEVAGVNIEFVGSGMIDDVRLTDGNGAVVYEEKFE